MTDTIKKLSADEIYVATIKFYSRGDSEEVATIIDVSHVLDNEFQGEIPASYGVAREIMAGIHENTVMYASSDEDVAFLNDPQISEEDKVKHILDVSQAQEESLKATLN